MRLEIKNKRGGFIMKRIIVFGIGYQLKRMINRKCLSEYDIVAFCDNDSGKWGQEYEGKRIISPDDISMYEYENIVITTKIYEKEIREELINKYDIPDDKIRLVSVQEDKYEGEMEYWRMVYRDEGNRFANDYYEDLMLSIAQEKDDTFLKNKVVVDFGCGPRGSLQWMKSPAVKIGVDVLTKQYVEAFGEALIQHGMIYVTSTEQYIPLPNECADCVCTINSLDHVNSLEVMSREILRILKPQGVLLASFNLNQPSTECEPQTLTQEKLKNCLLNYFEIENYRLAYRGKENVYENMENGRLVQTIDDEEAVLWVRGKKK